MTVKEMEPNCVIHVTGFLFCRITAFWDKSASSLVLNIMDERQTLKRDLERYRALLRVTTDKKAIAALRQLIRETLDRINTI
jgi:hypothetical protein